MKHEEKVRYSRQREAIRAAIAYSRRGKALRVYRCGECHGWHLTSQTRYDRKTA